MKYNFSEILADETKLGKKISQGDYLVDGQFPIIDQGQKEIAGYSNETDGLFQDVPAIIFGDHTRVLKFVNKPFFLGADGVKLLKQKRNEDNAKYLFYALKNVKIPNTGYNRHFKWLKEAHIEIPKRKQQDAVVKILDSITALISLRQRQAEKLDELVKARFVEMFGNLRKNDKNWPMRSLVDFAKIDTQMIHDLSAYEDYPHIGIDSIEKGTGHLSGYHTVKEDGVISGKYLFTPKHIIYSKIRPNLNKVALPDFTGVCSADAYPILPESKLCDRVFLAYVMRSELFLSYILAFANRTNLPKVNKKQVEGFSCPLPPLPLQNAFATFVHEVDREKERIQRSAALLETLKRSLMQQYFG